MMDIRCAPCQICGSASSGFHFGVLACEGCKGFYRRAIKFNLVSSYKCLSGYNDCEVSIKSRKCQKCRYAKCIEYGMAPEASKTGRPTKVRQAQIQHQLEQLRSENKLLPAPTTLPPHLLQQQREKQEKTAKKVTKKPGNVTDPDLIDRPSIMDCPSLSGVVGLSSMLSPGSTASLVSSSGASGCKDYNENAAFDLPSSHQCQADQKSPKLERVKVGNNDGMDEGSSFQKCQPMPTTQEFPQLLMNNSATSSVDDSTQLWQPYLPNHSKAPTVITPLPPFSSLAHKRQSTNSCFQRCDRFIHQIVESAANLSKLQSTRAILAESSFNLPEIWRRLLNGFETNAVTIVNFIKTLPGFAYVDLHDRIALMTHAMMPLLYAQLCLDVDPKTETINFFPMSPETADLVISTYTEPDKMSYLDAFRQQFVEAGHFLQKSSLSMVEFGLLCALIFFNPEISGLKDAPRVDEVRAELTQAAEAFINERSSDEANKDGIVLQRVANFRSLVAYFRRLNNFASWLRSLTILQQQQQQFANRMHSDNCYRTASYTAATHFPGGGGVGYST